MYFKVTIVLKNYIPDSHRHPLNPSLRKNRLFFSLLRIRIWWIRKNMRIHGVKYQPKTAKRIFLLLNPKSELLKKRDYKNFLNSEWFIKDKNKRKKNWKLFFVKKKSVNLKEMTWIPFYFFPSADPGSGAASKLNGT